MHAYKYPMAETLGISSLSDDPYKSEPIPGFRKPGRRTFTDAYIADAVLRAMEGVLITSIAEESGISLDYMQSICKGASRRKAWIMAEQEYIRKHGRYPPERMGGGA